MALQAGFGTSVAQSANFADFCRDEDEVEARCLLAFSQFIGSPSIAADHDGRSRADVVEQALEQLSS